MAFRALLVAGLLQVSAGDRVNLHYVLDSETESVGGGACCYSSGKFKWNAGGKFSHGRCYDGAVKINMPGTDCSFLAKKGQICGNKPIEQCLPIASDVLASKPKPVAAPECYMCKRKSNNCFGGSCSYSIHGPCGGTAALKDPTATEKATFKALCEGRSAAQMQCRVTSC